MYNSTVKSVEYVILLYPGLWSILISLHLQTVTIINKAI